VWNWHHDAMCEHLEAVVRDEIESLVINVPPGCSKSLVCSVLFPAWLWTLHPDWRVISASYSDTVVLRDARKARTLIESDWYRERWPEVQLPSDTSASKAVGAYYTTAGGMRFSTTVRGAVTGQHADVHVIDDPHDPAGVASLAELDATLAWHRETMSSRFRDPKHPRKVLVMQRLHERDLTSELIREGATVLCLPMRFERAHPHRSESDPRTEEGELLMPERYPEHVVAKLETKLGPTASAAQLKQRPSPAGGGIFKREYFARRCTHVPDGGVWTISVDAAFKKTTDSDFIAMQVWLAKGTTHFLVDQVHGRMGFSDTCKQLVALCEKYPQAIGKLIEDKANGPAIIDALKSLIAGLVPIEPEGGKEARAQASEPLWAAGNVVLPDELHARYPDGRVGAPWVAEFVAEHLSFPKGANDDQVDAATQYLTRHAKSFASKFEEAMNRL
jgi:predicted phage terminase large subunit-like protein